jgi:glutamine synthetase
MARYLLGRVAEDYEVSVSIRPKLFAEWSGSGCHVNVTTESMRKFGGLGVIMDAVKSLEGRHL